MKPINKTPLEINLTRDFMLAPREIRSTYRLKQKLIFRAYLFYRSAYRLTDAEIAKSA